MAKGTPTFIIELPLNTTPHDERELDIRFHAAQKLYCACLGEALKRLERMWQSPE
jgi:putative transposase